VNLVRLLPGVSSSPSPSTYRSDPRPAPAYRETVIPKSPDTARSEDRHEEVFDLAAGVSDAGPKAAKDGGTTKKR
jgi:hypothetical protein